MVKNNPYYIKEIKKPSVEMVQEIPSWEEFEKNWQEDEKVGNSYESEFKSYGDIRVEKSYGPGNNMSNEEGKRVVKGVTGVTTGIGVAALTILCPPVGAVALATTAATAGGAKIVSSLAPEDSTTKEVADFIGDTYTITTSIGAGPSGLKYAKDQVKKK